MRKDTNRPSDRGEILDYYQQMSQQYMNAHTFPTIKEFQQHIEEQYHIIANEWESIVKINSTEGGVEAFFDECKQTNQLFDRLLIPTVEGAIAGHNENTFADTFEKHRASFKLYKELKEQIEENKAVEEELIRYVATYEGLHKEQQAYEQKKQRAKAVLNLINQQEQEKTVELQNLESRIKEWESDRRNFYKKELSLGIQKEQSFLNTLQVDLQDYLQQLNIGKEDLVQAKTTFYSLKLAELNEQQKEEQDRLFSLQKQLETFDENQDIQEIKGKLEENSQEINGYFTNELEESKKRQQELNIEKQPIVHAIQESNSKARAQTEQLEQAKKTFNQNQGIIQNLEKQLNRIRNKILSKPDQESVSDQLQQWEKRLVHLDDQIVHLKTNNKQLSLKMAEYKEQSELVSKKKEEKESARTKLAFEIDQVERAHYQLKNVLAALRSQWATYDSIYLKQDSLTQQIHDFIQRLNKQREDSLFKERLAHRFIDDYGHQDLFFADPYIEKQIKQWKNQFHLVETGVQFIQSLEGTSKADAMKYPLWPMTLVTIETEKIQLKQKIQNIDQHLQFPIDVLSIEQAQAIVQGEQQQQSSPVIPRHWIQNQQPSSFQDWIQSMKKSADEATYARVELEERVDVWNRGADKLATFLCEYPYTEYQENKDHKSNLDQEIQELSLTQQNIQSQLDECERLLSTQRETIETYEKEYQGLQGRLESAYEFLSLEKETIELKKFLEQLSSKIEEINKTIKRFEIQAQRLNDELNIMKEQEREENSYFNKLMDDSLYLEVKAYSLTFTNKAINILKEEREELKHQLRKSSSSRREIEIKLEHSQKEYNRISIAKDDTILDYGPLDEEMIFPPNGKEQIAFYRDKMKNFEKSVDERTTKFNQVNEKKIKQDKAVEIAYELFSKEFRDEEPIIFKDSLSEVQLLLKQEKKKLNEKIEFLQSEQRRKNDELESIKTAFHVLDRYEEAHHFKGPSVVATVLSEQEISDFTYERTSFVEHVTKGLRQGKNNVSKEWEKVERAKELFKTFCKTKITNVKMQKMAQDGIDSKRTYKEVVEFQTHMQKRITTAIKYNEASIIDHDKQLEQFVTHINSHLFTIAGELELIPKKTRVKVVDKWREIFKFSIPEWSEEEGKGRIRKHIEWILEQLESEKYVNSEGIEDFGRVRKDIETWIQSKQLLRVVMNNESMKVTCRKVTNDNEVTTSSYSWEQSNVWSGGEKWSKNMTLFLGILNYVAEKQKHIESNMKRHRVVILDNPFGKASSDHVLNPVFFIAEQLGFQIIALTAHAEGKFLRDYFPVIYSCRLRKAADTNKQIMTKVKQLHQAYFQDHEFPRR
ncbi:hypothetical protein [Metabacillus endolithicus]|uniref:hypothetical protein n=1 Tax=Metabacillus endolithicus TaxID=1535204 RepID=UPI001FF81603|nr:hypothetical protein [Metabacillus endolithicus]UPG63901.1 hypothetical protein MVE64_01730 [Metabacillus endolithicus]